MAHIYGGDLNKIDEEVLRAVERLPDDFWVFAEFNIERNIDWLIIREVPASQKAVRSSTMIMTELKRESRPLRGLNMNGAWERLGDSAFWEEIHTSGREFNYYQQALKTSDALQNWLWTNQRMYLDGVGTFLRPRDDFKAWPDLLIISPPGTIHQLPIRPPTGYGGFWFELEKWVNHVQTWNPRSGCALNSAEIVKLAEVLGLKSLSGPSSVAVEASNGHQPNELSSFLSYIMRMEERITQLERQVVTLSQQESRSPSPYSPPRFTPPEPPVSRPLTEEEREAIEEAVENIRRMGKSRAVPSVLDEINMKLGYNLRDRSYNGFNSARNLFEQAKMEGIIKYGPFRGPNATIYLTDEEIPVW